ncbi:MAG: carbon storage regulator [Phycisphaeraceae bacterium]|nr:carbon storage regulator [Phycisphaeraceae bacterium]
MLVLTRKPQESVVVGGSNDVQRLLKVTVLEIRRRHVRLGFEVDAQVPVHRWEVWQRTRAGVQPTQPPSVLVAK